MKPGDHPEFFRFPAPSGRSRESTIRIDEHGRFFHDGELVAHRQMAQAFASWVQRHPDDGRYILSNGYDWTYIEVADAPLVVRRVDLRAEPALVTLSDGRSEPLDRRSLRLGSNDALYVDVRGGTLPARFSPHAQTSLADSLRETADGFALQIGAELVPISHVD